MFLMLVLVVLVFSLLLICGGVAIGSLLRVVFTSVDRGTSILIGVVACAASIHFLVLIFEKAPIIQITEPGDEDAGYDEDAPGSQPEPIRPSFWVLPPSDQPSRKRRRKRR
jgi:hypothetical protein